MEITPLQFAFLASTTIGVVTYGIFTALDFIKEWNSRKGVKKE